MKSALRKDNVLSILGTAGIVGFFVFVIYLPNERACQAARRDILQANRIIDEMPHRIALASEQQKRVAARQDMVRQLDHLLDSEDELHVVLQRVADLAKGAGLRVDRIQPQPLVNRETFRSVPYQISVFGSFRRIASFLKGLESEPTLFVVDRLSLKSESEKAGAVLRADMTFSVFVKRESFAGSAEKSDRPTPTQADES